MDTRTLSAAEQRAQQERQERIREGLETIKNRMPKTYQSIKDKAAEIGDEAYRLVRRGLGGQANCFYAFERGYVVGTPFNMPSDVMPEMAAHMVVFGVSHLCMFGYKVAGAADGTN